MFLGMPPSRWGLLVFSRLWLNAGVRLAYPFLPTIARGLGVTMEQAGLLVAARSLVGLSGILFGLLCEKKGEKVGLLLGLFFFSLSGFAVGYGRSFPWVLLGFLFMGLAHAVYNPAVQTYVSAHVPYGIRARALGLLESSWSAGWFVGMPLGGVLIARYGWNMPYIVLGVIGIVLLLPTAQLPSAPGVPQTVRFLRHPPVNPSRNPTTAHVPELYHAGADCRTLQNPLGPTPSKRLWAALMVTFCALLANENLMIVYGVWMESRFSVGIGPLGWLSTFIGASELGAELSVALIADRLGKKRALAAGLFGAAVCYAALSVAQTSLVLSVIVFCGIAYCFEFTVVSSFPYISELNPNTRGRWLSANYSLMVAGRVVGALCGPWLWQHTQNLAGHIAVSFLSTGLALVFLRLAPNPDRPRGRVHQ